MGEPICVYHSLHLVAHLKEHVLSEQPPALSCHCHKLQVCAYEGMLEAMCRLERLGLGGRNLVEVLITQPADRLRLAFELLASTGAVAAAGAAVVAAALHGAPWATTDAFVWAMREPTKGILHVAGPADPTGGTGGS